MRIALVINSVITPGISDLLLLSILFTSFPHSSNSFKLQQFQLLLNSKFCVQWRTLCQFLERLQNNEITLRAEIKCRIQARPSFPRSSSVNSNKGLETQEKFVCFGIQKMTPA